MSETSTGEEALKPQLPVVLPLLETRQETRLMATLLFPVPDRPDPSFDLPSLAPGRFIMVWLPGLDEKPYAVSSLGDGRFGLTVMRRGAFSTALHEAAPGALVGFRGPYGRGFWGWEDRADPQRIVILGGGCGMAPLKLLADRIPGATVIQGAPTGEDVLFRDHLPDQIVFTEDGSLGRKGFPTLELERLIERGEVDAVYTCGPEPMMAAVVELCRGAAVECQASLERYMKCGFGVCGQCECDGRLVCRDGPVFSAAELENMPSFGKATRLKTGRKVDIAADDACALPESQAGP